MKRRKGNKILNARTLELITDKVVRYNSSYEKFKKFIYTHIYTAASNGTYYTSIEITDFNKEYYKKIEKELEEEDYSVTFYDYSYNGTKIAISWKKPNNINVTNKEADDALIQKLNNELELMLRNKDNFYTGYRHF